MLESKPEVLPWVDPLDDSPLLDQSMRRLVEWALNVPGGDGDYLRSAFEEWVRSDPEKAMVWLKDEMRYLIGLMAEDMEVYKRLGGYGGR